MNLALFLGGIYLLTFLLGILLEKIRIPWIFAALILGLFLAFHNPFEILTSSGIFKFLAWIGMYFLLFWIGYELELKKIKKLGKFIVKSVFFIIFFEAFFGSLLIHFVFGYDWFVSILVALSFATIGEAVLIPILDEFRLTKTKLGQTIIGIGVLDDTIEIFAIILAVLSTSILIGETWKRVFNENLLTILSSLISIFVVTLGIIKLKKRISKIKLRTIKPVFLLVLTVLFLFVGIESEVAALGALLSGIIVKNLFPRRGINEIEPTIKTITYGLFGPIFFVWVGIDANINYILSYPLLVILVIGVSYVAKVFASYLIAKKELGLKKSIVMGISLGVRFSTSIVVIKFLFEKTIIGVGLYSTLIASTIAGFIIPFLLSFLIFKWKITS